MPKSTFNQQKQEVERQQNAARDIYNVSQIEKDPFEQEEIFHNASCTAKAIQILGIILIVIGFVAFAGGGFLSVSRMDPTYAMIGFGIFFLGMIMTVVGQVMTRSEAYKRRVENQRKQSGKAD